MNSKNRVSLVLTLITVLLAASNFGCGGGSSGSQQQPLTITTASLPNGTVGTPYMQTIQATGGVGPFAWTVSVGALPHNLNLNSSATNLASISGTPDVQQASVTFSIKVTDSTNQSASQPYAVTIGGTSIVVSISPTSASLQESGTQQFAATVTNDPKNSGVTWSLDVVRTPAMGSLTCSNGVDCGQISPTSTSSGASTIYTAPSAVFGSQTEQVLVTATSVTDNTKSATVTVTIVPPPPPPISVVIGPVSALIQVNGTIHFSAGVRYDPANAGVTWSISGCTGGAIVCGSITNSGPFTADYVAPVAVPPGGNVTVTATSVTDNTKSASSTVTINPITFAPQNYPAGNTPVGVAVADFNGDGKLDIAVADYGNPSAGDNGGVSILLGNGDGTFQPAISVNAGKNPISIGVGDFNNDGKKDLVVADFGDRTTGGIGSVSVLLGNGDGTFQTPVTLSAGNEPFALAVGDFDSDGKPDFAVSDFNGGVYLLLGNGDGSFRAPTLVSTGNSPVAIAAHDFNGDGKLDLAVAGSPLSGFNSTVSILLGNGDGTFAPPVPYVINEFLPTSIATGDLSGNGKTDLVITTYACVFGLCRAPIVTLAGNGDGTFQASQVPALTVTNSVFLHPPGFSLSLQVADFNGDGKVDLVEITGPYAAVFPGNGDGSFEGALFFSADQGPFQLAVGDFNGDGKPDIVVANHDNNDITILLNKSGH